MCVLGSWGICAGHECAGNEYNSVKTSLTDQQLLSDASKPNRLREVLIFGRKGGKVHGEEFGLMDLF